MCKVAEKMKRRRLELNLTLEDVAQAVGVGRSTVRKWENGIIKNIGNDKIWKLSKILQMDPVDFVPANEPINNRLSIEDEELQKLWGGASIQAKRATLAILRELTKNGNH